jgi:carboxyl-terminal processing protease
MPQKRGAVSSPRDFSRLLVEFMKRTIRVTSGVGLVVLLAAIIYTFVLPRHGARAADGLTAVDYADKMSLLVKGRKIDELSKLDLPAGTETATLSKWKTDYLSTIRQSEVQRDKQYAEAVSKAQDFQTRNKLDEAMDKTVSAYMIAKDQEAFLKLDWVQQLTDKVATKAADLEKKGQWIESLQLYSDLNSLYEISTRYKADMQRLARRTRLLAMYTPKILFEMRKAVISQLERDKSVETQPKDDDELPSFSRWQDHVENITYDMLKDSCDKAVKDWVEKTSYSKLMVGGAEALRLFLSTPGLGQEFAGLKDEKARKEFAQALDDAVTQANAGEISAADFATTVSSILEINDRTVMLPKEVAIMEFTDGAMEKLDPFTAVIWPHEVDEFEKNTRGTFGGVGVQISLENGLLKVISPLEDTPAYKAGIEAGDVITSVDGKSTVGISIDQAVHMIMGEAGTPVVLKIKREGQTEQKEYSITRANIKVTSIKGVDRDMTNPESPKWNFMLDNQSKIGYIRITGFQEDTARDLEAALTLLQKQGAQGLILDLRFNPGGLLKAAVDISDMFLEQGVIVSTKGRTPAARDQKWLAHKDSVVPPSLPIVVMVNQYSASASEIFSGAIKDHHRGLIVGQRSFGKGSVQNLIPLGSGAKIDALMKLTMAYYYLPDGESLHRRDGNTTWGVDPDVQVDLTPKQLGDMVKARRDAEIIHRGMTPATAPETAPATTAAAKDAVLDTQLDTALLMLRLQLVQLRN